MKQVVITEDNQLDILADILTEHKIPFVRKYHYATMTNKSTGETKRYRYYSIHGENGEWTYSRFKNFSGDHYLYAFWLGNNHVHKFNKDKYIWFLSPFEVFELLTMPASRLEVKNDV